ncbi:MAG: hypothetical protein GQ534_04400 [Candidatus Delongbacteria bacterium]|nr:hypothetical protein [Candidatus Delongbacteria bacterium]
MINTKLILVDGITGSGKSTTAHYIARQMKKNGIKVKWLHEEERNHPLAEMQKNKGESDEDHTKRVLIEYPKKWIDFTNKIKNDEYIYIVESYLFQDMIMFPHFMNDLERQKIKDFSHSILKITSCLNPVLIHFYQKDVEKSLKLNWKRRGNDWTKGFISFFKNTLYCKNRNIKGKKGVIKLWDDFTSLTLELFKEFNYRKIQIENSEHKWEEYRNNILTFLKLKRVDEKLYTDSFKYFYGEYFGFGELFNLHEKDNRLYIDTFWPNLKLIPVAKNELEMEGFPISFKFYKYRGKKKLKILKADCYYKKNGIADEYIPYNISEKELSKFCGKYYCESEKLDRKIFMENGKLYYYWCDKNSQCQLIPAGKNKFIKLAGLENLITFENIKGSWQFSVWDKGYKSDAVFEKKK